ncbi:DNA alkylation repair protein, partial [Aliarcobacter butzleri]|nr:DNA alkylation repair protein [Aliarcobacter butzleri]
MASLLKDLYSKEFIEKLSEKLFMVYPKFEKKEFIENVFCSTWQELELKPRMRHISTIFHKHLPFSYKEQLDILKKVKEDFAGLEAMIFQDFVQVFGLDDLKESLKALEVFTIDSSSEFAIRQFILKYEEETMNQMKLWAKSSNEHLRRLASEGCRPRLPWAIALAKFKENPKKVLEIIELLKNDKSKYVQKSVANNLNDISKDNPNFVIEFVKDNLGFSKELDFICRHGSRTLLKSGNIEVLKLFSFEKVSHINISDFYCDESVEIGQDLNFSFELNSDEKLGSIRVE